MVESISELKKITQKPGGERGNWMVRHITRNQAIYITWLLLHTRISADGVVVLSIIAALLSGALFAIGTPIGYVLGALFLHLWYIFDHVDGQVARYRKQTNITGIFFDYIVHYIVNFTLAIGLGIGCYHASSEVSFLFWGILFAVSITMFNAISDVRAKAFITNIVRSGTPVQANLKSIYPESNSKKPALSLIGVIKSSLGLAHKFCEVHVMMNVILISSLFHWLGGRSFQKIMEANVVVYAVVLSLLWILRVIKIILDKRIDTDYKTYFSGENQ